MVKRYTAKSFHDALILCLGRLSNFTPDQINPMKAVIEAVLRVSKLDAEALGEKYDKLETHRLIQLAFRSQRTLAKPLTVSPSKGKWALTPRGVARARVLHVPRQPGRRPSVPLHPDPKVQEKTDKTQVYDTDKTQVYDTDTYLRSLAIAKSPCFGILYDSANSTCQSCLFEKDCHEALWERCAKVAVNFAKALESQKPEVLSSYSATKAKTAAPAESSPLILTQDEMNRAARIKVATRLVCQLCEKGIKKDSHGYFIATIGTYHPDCFSSLRAKPATSTT